MALFRCSRSLASTFHVPVSRVSSGAFLLTQTIPRQCFCTKEEEEEEEIGEELRECGVPVADVHTDEDEHHEERLEPHAPEDTKYMKKKPFSPPSPEFSFRFNRYGPGIYKGILLGTVGQKPVEKMFSDNTSVVIFSLGTGGLRNNRKQLEGEEWETYAERSFTQWHRVCVFKVGLLEVARTLAKGVHVYVEGNIETRVYNDAVTGVVKRVRELCIRQSGRLYMVD